MQHLIRLLDRNEHLFEEHQRILLVGNYDQHLLNWFQSFANANPEVSLSLTTTSMQTYNRAQGLFTSIHDNYNRVSLYWNIDTVKQLLINSAFNTKLINLEVNHLDVQSLVPTFSIDEQAKVIDYAFEQQIKQLQPTAVVILLPKSKGELLMQTLVVKQVNSLLANLDKQPVKSYLLGDNDHGIKSINKFFENDINVVDNAGHGRILSFVGTPQVIERESDKHLKQLCTRLTEGFNYITLPGVFSAGSADKGSQFLIESFKDTSQEQNQLLLKLLNPERLTTNGSNCFRILDYAAGSGYLTLVVLKLLKELYNLEHLNHNYFIDLIDSDITSLHSAAINLNLNNSSKGARLFAATSLSDVNPHAKVRYDLIISNPAFHDGQKIDYTITENLVRDAKNNLTNNGQFRMVGNSHLPYDKIINKYFKQVIKTPAKDFTVWTCINSR